VNRKSRRAWAKANVKAPDRKAAARALKTVEIAAEPAELPKQSHVRASGLVVVLEDRLAEMRGRMSGLIVPGR